MVSNYHNSLPKPGSHTTLASTEHIGLKAYPGQSTQPGPVGAKSKQSAGHLIPKLLLMDGIDEPTSGLQALLELKADPNCIVKGQGSPLALTASKGYLACMSILLEHKADPNLRQASQSTPP